MRYLFLIFCFVTFVGRAQQKGLNYQAVILDPNPIEIPGQVVSGQAYANGQVWVRFTLVSKIGIDYEEVQQTKTDAHGLVNLMIGSGQSTRSQGTLVASGNVMHDQFDQIDWGGEVKRLRVALSFTGLGDYVEVSNQWLSFSPYSLYAAAVDYTNVRDAPKKLGEFTNDVGYLIPRDLEPVKIQVHDLAIENKLQGDQLLEGQTHFLLLDQHIQKLSGRVDVQESSLANARVSIAGVAAALVDHDQRISQQSSQVTSLQGQLAGLQNQVSVSQSILGSLNTVYEAASNKSNALDLGNVQPSSSLFPTQLAVKTYVDQQLSQAISTGAPDATTLATGKVQLAGDLGGTASSPQINRLQGSSLQASNPSAGQVLKFNGTAWVPDVVLNSEVQTLSLSGTVLTISGTNSSVTLPTVVDASSSQNGLVRLAGDLGGTASAPVILDNVISTAKLVDGAVTDAKFSGVLSVAKGGTGATSLTGMVKGNGTSAMTAAVANTDYSLVRLVSDEFTVSTAGQTSFTLTQTPNANSVNRLYINGVRISKTAISVSGRTVTYSAANNGSANLVVNDRIQIDYYY